MRWRFHPRGILGLLLAIVIGINLYVLADNIVRLIKQRGAEAELRQRVANWRTMNGILQQERDWMKSDDFLREQAHNLGYVAPGEAPAAPPEQVTPDASSPVKRRRDRPCQPY